MFKQFFSILLTLSVFIGQAHAAAHEGLKEAFDELNYSLVVEWDQKDESFKAAQISKFEANLNQLKEGGLSDQEILGFVKSQIKNEQVSKDIDQLYNMVELDKMTPAEAQLQLTQSMEKSYSAGASWNSGTTFAVIVLVIIAAGFIFSSIENAKKMK